MITARRSLVLGRFQRIRQSSTLSQYAADGISLTLGAVNVAERVLGIGNAVTVPSDAAPLPPVVSVGTTSTANHSQEAALKTAPFKDPRQPQPPPKPRVIVEPPTPTHMTPAAVPATRLSRLFQYSALAGGVAAGVVGGAVSSVFASDQNSLQQNSLVFSKNNMDRIVARLSRMRGAALKLGTRNDSAARANSANYMPDSQLMKMMHAELGENWKSDHFASFTETPFAAASIGQVHYATLLPTTPTSPPTPVAVKIQYPGVAQSIDSDISYLRTLSMMGSILPRGMYLDNTLPNAMIRFRELLEKSTVLDGVYVPKVFEHVSTSKVLTCEFVPGVSIGSIGHLDQAKRDEIGTRMLRLCLEQLFTFRFMQTDPNWSNFLYDEPTDTIQMLDFGAAREFSADFTVPYLSLLKAASLQDREGAIQYSQKLDITSSVRADIPVMLKERLTPPPDESYSLHRSLSGSFLLCAKLGARVDCASLFVGWCNFLLH
ncbi:ABC1-domain-containing protein [Rhizoclosmatium globosum]|uniref:ABC1-domain-containing protein n=1 Tax=Rhizoclosmatium globosum TaxID=329046 RepID=A0A1Y2BZR7_9FUNG|nr:ABC1-domain-containing protein [Rhizoclosmatium globosum]|eukprot:ORY40164.1 ABC1-domain-containing protein [Rhizoclosmatium globosum]